MHTSPIIQNLLDLIDADAGFACSRASRANVAEIDDDGPMATRRLTNMILGDAGLTAQLIRHANGSDRTLQSVATIDKTIAVLGIDKIRTIAASMAGADAPARPTDDAHLRQLQAEGVAAAFCGLFAAGLTRANAPRFKAQESQVCGLLQNMGRLFASYYLYDEIIRSHARQAHENLSEDEAVAITFGVSFEQIGGAIARHWQFPDVLQKSLDPPADKVPARPLASTLEWHQHCAGFARRITDALFRKPAHQMKGTISGEIHAYRTMLHLKDPEVQELIERCLADVDRPLPDVSGGARVASAREMLRKSSERVTDWLSSQDSLTKSSVTDARRTRVEIIYQILRCIHDEFHFDMTLLCVPNGSNELVAISGIGRNANQIISRFRFGGARADLFRSVAAKAIGVYVPDVEAGPYAKFIPHWYKTLVGARSLYLMSLMHEGESLGVVYGDFTARREIAPDGLDSDRMRQWRIELVAALRPEASRKG